MQRNCTIERTIIVYKTTVIQIADIFQFFASATPSASSPVIQDTNLHNSLSYIDIHPWYKRRFVSQGACFYKIILSYMVELI